MGVDIHGWVETRPRYRRAPLSADLLWRRWDGIVKLDHLLGRNSAAFTYLFGVYATADDAPLITERGIPDDVSEEVEDDYLTWAEDPYGARWPGWLTWAELQGADRSRRVPQTIRVGEPPILREWWGPDWAMLFAIMGILASEYGDNGVRIVVWFDH